MANKRVLITGVSGFIAGHTALEFLNAGYQVRGTVRSASKGKAIAEVLGRHGDTSKLELVEADLNSDKGWNEAVQGCDCVAHLASPLPISPPKNEQELIQPAVGGTLRVLKAARDAGVERFVQTSSSYAVTQGHPHSKSTFNEDDWTNLEAPNITAYQKAKTLSEIAGRDFAAAECRDMQYASVCPTMVWGPLLGASHGASVEIIRMLLAGKYPGAPRLKFAITDVRDIAKLHRLAMETDEPSGGRYIGSGGSLWLIEIAQLLRSTFGKRGRKAPRLQLPDFLVKAIGLVDPAVRSVLPDLGLNLEVDNHRTRQALGIEFRPPEDAVLASANSLIEHGLV